MDCRINWAFTYAKKRGFVRNGDYIIVVTGWKAGSGSTNTMRVIQLEDDPNEKDGMMPILSVPSLTKFED